MIKKRDKAELNKLDRRIDFYGKECVKKSRGIFLKEVKPPQHVSFDSLMNEESFTLVSGYYDLFNFSKFNKSFNLNLIHNPKRKDQSLEKFQEYSEEMIAFAKASGLPGHRFISKICTPKIQKEIFYSWLGKLKLEFSEEKGKKNERNWWDSKREFTSLIPIEYRWTKAPRLSVKGTTINGIKKPLKRSCLLAIACADPNFVIIDLDMRSAHSFIAAKLAGEDSLIRDLINNKNIWADKIQEIRRDFPSYVSDKELKNSLKIGVYGTLNGGNPTGAEILDDNIIEGVFGGLDHKRKDEVKHKIQKVLKEWKLIDSIKELNELVSVKSNEGNIMYGIDRIKEYELKERHKMISRYLQGYEVVLLSIISYYILFHGGLVVSLEHDGVVCLFRKKKTQHMLPQEVVSEVTQLIEQSLKPWSELLLGQNIPLEAKLCITEKGIKEY